MQTIRRQHGRQNLQLHLNYCLKCILMETNAIYIQQQIDITADENKSVDIDNVNQQNDKFIQ